MKSLWKGKAHRTTEAEAVRFGLRFLYFAAGRENNQLEHFSDDRIATPPTEQGFLEFKESKTRLLHGNKLRQQIVGDYLRGVGIFRQIRIFDGLDAHRASQYDHGALAGDGRVGGKRAVAALNDTMLAPAPDGAFGPVPRVVAVGRPRRARAYGEQTGRHGKGKNKR